MKNNFQFSIFNFQIKEDGFTLVELLVVIGIVTMITALLFPNFMGARQRARDSQRKTDVRQIQGALELYKLDQDPPAYPSGSFTSAMCRKCWTQGGSAASCPAGNIYMSKFSCDPGSNDPTPYLYSRDANEVLKYNLSVCLENLADSDRDPTPNPTCQAGSFTSYTVSEP